MRARAIATITVVDHFDYTPDAFNRESNHVMHQLSKDLLLDLAHFEVTGIEVHIDWGPTGEPCTKPPSTP